MKSLKEEWQELKKPKTLLAFIMSVLFIVWLTFGSGLVTVKSDFHLIGIAYGYSASTTSENFDIVQWIMDGLKSLMMVLAGIGAAVGIFIDGIIVRVVGYLTIAWLFLKTILYRRKAKDKD